MNFLCNRELVARLVRNSSVSQGDLVLEIGPGKGIVTEILLDVCKKVIAVEINENFLESLKSKFAKRGNLNLVWSDFLSYPLPKKEKYKVFSNIPFYITGEIIKKLLFSENPPVDSYLVVQKDAADKFIPGIGRNSMLATLFYPWFEIQIVYKFLRTDFRPSPKVDSCLIRIEKRSQPLLGESRLTRYRDFVVHHFTRTRSAPKTAPREWIKNFTESIESNEHRNKKVFGSFATWQIEERRLPKIHRTRAMG